MIHMPEEYPEIVNVQTVHYIICLKQVFDLC
jgi:hypothetical protein